MDGGRRLGRLYLGNIEQEIFCRRGKSLGEFTHLINSPVGRPIWTFALRFIKPLSPGPCTHHARNSIRRVG